MDRARPVPYESPSVAAAYDYCESVTGQQARNFAYGIRLLPTGKRRAMSALYAFSRRVDDIGDGPLEQSMKVARLEATRQLLGRIREGAIDQGDTDPVAVALSDAARRYPVPMDGLDELIDGVLLDVHGTRYGSWEELEVYCRCVAGAIGRLSLGVFGTLPGVRDAVRASEYADTLGLALQLTNILRDIREDADHGRTYLPAEDLEKFGCSAGFRSDDAQSGSDFRGLVHHEVQRARALFAQGYRLLPLLDRRSGACVAAMAGIYQRLLERIAADPFAVLHERVSLPNRQKAYVAVRGLTGIDARHAARRSTRA